MTSIDRAVCLPPGTGPLWSMRSSGTALASRDLQEHVLERGFLDVDIDDPDPGVADVEDGLGYVLLLDGDHHHVRAARQVIRL